MLFMHEVHRIVGKREAEFEAAYRDDWMKALAQTDYARLLWYFTHAHGSGMAYNVVTVTAISDGAGWEELARRMQEGDLKDWNVHVHGMRYDVVGKLLLPVYWSPMQEVDLGNVPTDGALHEPSVYMEDTGWPYAPLDEYIELWDKDYYQHMKELPPEQVLLDIQGCFQPAFGTHIRPEAMLMQKVLDYDILVSLLTSTEEYDPNEWPGSYMHRGLELRDQWESKLLRTAEWSPLH